uniref:Uncharacterized protein LOC104218541 n=1 Tax=Nicotiana sylvestris TaxID=4096 RepID=A0A1U7VZD7_NICSY|nr:PREDICTED: uncharacterized protein LOC104218541 [Nicotiana sylvestris]
MDNHELITVFLEAQGPDYFQNMMSAMGRPFAEAIKIGKMVENDLKTGRIVSQTALKATTQAIQNGSGSFANRKKRDDGSMMTSGSRKVQRGASHPYVQVQQGQDYGREQKPVEKFTPLAESYSSLFQKLKQMGVIGPIAPYHIHPNSHGFQANARCEYHSVTNGKDPPNVTNKPLPAYNNVHCVGMIGRDQEYKPVGHTEMTVGAIQEGTSLEVIPSRDVSLIVKGAPNSEKVTLFVPKVSKLEVRSNVPSPRLYVIGGHPITKQNQGGTNGITEPIIIKPAVQPPVTNTKTLRKAKQIRGGQLPIKKPVTEVEAEEFLKKIKAQDYSIIDQLRKTPAQISLLSLLIHSKEHARVLIKVLNEAHISEETIVNELEKMANRFFEVNRISFTDDELPEEGAGHNRALKLMVKCEGHNVKRVMVDGDSSVDVCPLSTLQSMKINTDRIRPSNVRIRVFDGLVRDTMGEINLTMTSGPGHFEIVFQVVDMVTSYNFLLGRPWIHTARAVPSILHQMLKFEYDGQEIIVHGEDESSVYKDSLIPCIEAKDGSESIFYQAFEVVVVDHVEEGKPILHPRLSATFVMVDIVMIRQGYEPGKGLGASLQEILEPISPLGNQGTFGLGFRPTQADKNKSKHRKKISCPDLEKLSNIEITHQEVEYDEDELLKKDAAVRWTDDCQKAFDRIKDYLSKPLVLVPPESGRPLFLYLSVMDNSFGCILGQYDATGTKEQALADHLEENPVDNKYMPLSTYFPDEEVNSIEEVVLDDHPVWKMYFDGAVNIKEVGIGAILISPIGHHYPVMARLRFFYTNNMAEYEACIMGLKMAIDLDVHELLVIGDSDLLIRQA